MINEALPGGFELRTTYLCCVRAPPFPTNSHQPNDEYFQRRRNRRTCHPKIATLQQILQIVIFENTLLILMEDLEILRVNDLCCLTSHV